MKTTMTRERVGTGNLGVVLLLLLFGISLPAQAQTPKPGAEQKKLEVFLGAWKYEGDYKAGPLGPAGKFSGRQTGRWILDGFFLEWKGKEKGQFGDVRWTEVDWYDPVTKSYLYQGFQSDGTTWSGSFTLEGRVLTVSGTMAYKGTTYRTRGQSTFSADARTVTGTGDISTDGKVWTPWSEAKMTK